MGCVRSAQDVLEEFLACEQSWDKVRVPNQKTIDGLLNKSFSSLQEEILALEKQRPDCKQLLDRYEEHFSMYVCEVQNRLTTLKGLLDQFNFLLFKKEKIASLNETIDKLVRTREEYCDSLAPTSLEYTSRVLWKLLDLKYSIDSINPELIVELEVAKEELDKSHLILEQLLEPTHEWLTLSNENKKRCTKCSKEIYLPEKKEPPTIYDEQTKEYPHYW